MMPKVSILIPVFNREKFIEECIQSALSQTIFDLEVVVVDNASEDGTWDICQKIAKIDSRVRIFRNDSNIGPVRNWLRCIEQAKGEYGKLLFSDDLILPQFIETAIRQLEDPTVAFAYSAAIIGQEPSKGKVHFRTHDGVEVINTEEYLSRLAIGRPHVPFSPGAALFRLTDLRKNLIIRPPIECDHNFERNGAGPDVLLFALTATTYTAIAMINEPLVFFRTHSGSFSIQDEDGTVSKGYQLALGWFFKKYSTPRNWAIWTARAWIGQGKIDPRRINPVNIARNCGGTGNWKELAMIMVVIPVLLINRLVRP